MTTYYRGISRLWTQIITLYFNRMKELSSQINNNWVKNDVVCWNYSE